MQTHKLVARSLTLTLALAIAGLLLTAVPADAARPVGFYAFGTVEDITQGDVSPAGASGRFVVKNRVVTGRLTLPAPIEQEVDYSFTFGANVPLLTQAGQLHGTLTTAAGHEAKVRGTSALQPVPCGSVPGFPDFGIPADFPFCIPSGIPGLDVLLLVVVEGTYTFTAEITGNGAVNALLFVWPTEDFHIGGIVPGMASTIHLVGQWRP
jgi:hypothetical protein